MAFRLGEGECVAVSGLKNLALQKCASPDLLDESEAILDRLALFVAKNWGINSSPEISTSGM